MAIQRNRYRSRARAAAAATTPSSLSSAWANATATRVMYAMTTTTAVAAPEEHTPNARSLCNGISDAYSIGLHSGAIVVVLFASLIGTLLPLVTLYVPMLRQNPFVFVLAKTAATGVLLSVSTIHLLGDGISAFEEPCIPRDFYDAYPAYHLLFMIIAALAMHYVDAKMVVVGERWMRRRAAAANREGKAEAHDAQAVLSTHAGEPLHHHHGGDGNVTTKQQSSSDGDNNNNDDDDDDATCKRDSSAVAAQADCVRSPTHDSGADRDKRASSSSSSHSTTACAAREDDCAVCDAVRAMDDATCACDARAVGATAAATPAATTTTTTTQHASAHQHDHDHHHGHDDDNHHHSATRHAEHGATAAALAGHSHGVAVSPPEDMGHLRRVIAAVCMEFGVTLHSLFVGLDIGLAVDDSLKPLLIALVFHQLFEGMSVGSRLVDAKFNIGLDVGLAAVFSISAPIGMAAATIAASVRPDAMSGTGFVLMMAVLDSICAGILLYLAFNLLFIDFDAEMRVHCAPGQPRRGLKRCAMFIALWGGMLLMALIGKWC